MINFRLVCFIVCIAGTLSGNALFKNLYAQDKEQPSIEISTDGLLIYRTDSCGNRVPDFSYAGYEAGASAIPIVEIKAVVAIIQGDATETIQRAIDFVSNLPLNKTGFRGAVLLQPGTYTVEGTIVISASGVVLRGSGFNSQGTKIVGAGKSRNTLIEIKGADDRVVSRSQRIATPYVPVNATSFSLTSASFLEKGDRVLIHRPSTQEWVSELKSHDFGGGSSYLGWKAGSRDIYWDREITNIDGNTIYFDAPITTALDTTYGGGNVIKYEWPGRIQHVGIENIQLESEYDTLNLKDEDHRWMAITIENVENAWVRQVHFEHFAGSAVYVKASAKQTTVEDCISLNPVSEIGGQRRYTFITLGQQTLFQRLYSESGYHDFSAGYLAAGPNAFVQCMSFLPHSFSGGIDSWASGVLFDNINIDGNAIRFTNRGHRGNGAGWAVANSVIWQSAAALIENFKPPTAQNWAFGIWAQFEGDGYWSQSNEHVKPQSLYYKQLADRLGPQVYDRTHLQPLLSEASSSPTIEVATELTTLSSQPAPQLKDFIASAPQRQPISLAYTDAREFKKLPSAGRVKRLLPVEIKDGVLSINKHLLTGGRQDVQWWSGSSRSYWLKNARAHITRFVPGQSGLGLTDNLEELTENMSNEGLVAMEHNYGLWYDRRRDDHQRVRRMDGDVWPPFYELPFARSGQALAWDGLSKYDLRKYNHWYWSRLKEFADLADEKGLLLVHKQYFQHNILEAGAHYSDFPWRTANNINDVGFPEPPFYAGDKRVFMDEQFYDINHPDRREIHRAYIRQCLDNFKGNKNVIQLTGEEYTGPLHFIEFWIEVIKEWENENNQTVIVGLSTTKDVQDAILENPALQSVIDLIDIRYWHYQMDGAVYAPPGGKHLAPRQHARQIKSGKVSFATVYRSVLEYRQRYPHKAVIYSSGNYSGYGWPVLMAGGSLPNIPKNIPLEFLKQAMDMKPQEQPGSETYSLSDSNGKIIYSLSGKEIEVDLSDLKGNFRCTWIDPKTGELLKTTTNLRGKETTVLVKPTDGEIVLWIQKK